MKYSEVVVVVKELSEDYLNLEFFHGTQDSLSESIESFSLSGGLVHLDPMSYAPTTRTYTLQLAFLYKLPSDHTEAMRINLVDTAWSKAVDMIEGIMNEYTDSAGHLETIQLTGSPSIQPFLQFDYFGLLTSGCTLEMEWITPSTLSCA